jgi:hypothetical protein
MQYLGNVSKSFLSRIRLWLVFQMLHIIIIIIIIIIISIYY